MKSSKTFCFFSNMPALCQLRLSLAGVACGLAAAAILMRLMAKLLFEVKPVDRVTYAAVSACLVAAALAASYLPTLRITMIDPVNALRAE